MELGDGDADVGYLRVCVCGEEDDEEMRRLIS